MESCEFSVIRCPNNCGAELQRKKLQYHLEEECVRRVVACLYCDLKVIFQRQNEHYERCLRYPVTCPNRCEMELVRGQLNVHLESQCPLMIVKCQFRDAGCTFEGNLKELEVHMNDVDNNLHMRSLLDTVKRLERTINVLQSTIEQMSDREEKMEVVKAGDDVKESANLMSVDGARNNKIRLAETHRLTNQMRDLETKVAQCTIVAGMCRGEIKQTRIDTDSKCEKMQQVVSDQTNLINELNGRICCGRFIWKITGFDALFMQAKNGDLPAIHSQPFYTGLPGYKMCLRVNLNGIDSGAGSHVSMFVHLLQGEFDSIVEWPFPYGLTLTIKDQDPHGQPHHVTETLYARPSLQAFIRPETPRNRKGYGYIEMIAHDTLQTNGYIKNDAMVVEVIVKTSK